MPTIEGTTTELTEDSRTYLFPGGDRVELKNVIELTVRPSGTHRLKTKDGMLHLVSRGWLAITIEDSTTCDWTA